MIILLIQKSILIIYMIYIIHTIQFEIRYAICNISGGTYIIFRKFCDWSRSTPDPRATRDARVRHTTSR